MGRKTPRRTATIGFLVAITGLLGSAQAADQDATTLPVPPEVISQQFDDTEDQSLTTAGITLYAAGALYDLYTTKRAMDAGLHEGNPLLNGSDNPTRTLATAAVAKIGFAFLIGRLERHRSDRVRGAWYLSCGALQFGFGFANRRAIARERESTYLTTTAAPQPTPTATSRYAPSPAATSGPTPPPDEAAVALRRKLIGK